MTYFSQRDPRWSGVTLGSSNLTIGRWGCAYTSLVNLQMALTGKQMTAKRFIEIAKDPKNFTDKNYSRGAGLILWDKVCAALGGIKYDGIEIGAKFANIFIAIKDPERGVIVAVNKDSHFTTGWKVPKEPKKDVGVLDPNTTQPKVVNAVAEYHSVSGARYFRKV